MALTQSAWSEATSASGIYSAVCTVIATTAENDAYTLKTSTDLDPTKPWTLFYTASGAPDAQALPLEIWAGYSSSFAITGDGATIGATDGCRASQVIDDVQAAIAPISYVFDIDPDLGIAPVVTVAAIATGLKIKVPVAEYYAFNLNGETTLSVHTSTFRIIQDQG